MTDFLVKKFVKNYEHTEEAAVRTSYGVLASIAGIICNLFLFAGKLAIGIIIGSVSVTADAFNNLSDAASSIIGFVGVRMAGKPADKEHPFGHGRIEYVAALIVSFLIIYVGFTFLESAVAKIIEPESLSFTPVSVIILLASIAVKLWLSSLNRTLGRKIDSKVMLATSRDALNDVVTTAATLLSVLVFFFTGLNIDGYVGLAVSLVVIWSGIEIAKDTLEPLIGQPVDRDEFEKITKFAEGYEGVLGSHDLIVHNYGPTKKLASMHVEVPDTWDLEKAHALIDRIETDAERYLGIVLVIHIDPVAVNDKRASRLRAELIQVIADIDPKLVPHDIHTVEDGDHVNLLFDMTVPFSYSEEQVVKAHLDIVEKMYELDHYCHCVIKIENGYVAED